jgi:hypothetical protein
MDYLIYGGIRYRKCFLKHPKLNIKRNIDKINLNFITEKCCCSYNIRYFLHIWKNIH